MTNGTLSVHWTQDFRDSELATDVFYAFFGRNWLSIFFKNNTYFEKNTLNKYMLKINKRHTKTRCELLSKLTSKRNIRTMSLTSFGYLYC